MKYNIGRPNGPSGPFWSVVREDGVVFALQVPSEKLARRIAGSLEAADVLRLTEALEKGLK